MAFPTELIALGQGPSIVEDQLITELLFLLLHYKRTRPSAIQLKQ